MVYTKRTIWPLVIGIVMVGYAYLVQSGQLEPLLKYLNTGRYTGEMLALGYICGGISILAGLWHLAATPKEGLTDYYISTIAGVAFIMLVAFVVKWGLDPLMGLWGRAARPALGFNFASVLNLNYVVMGILAGIIVVNVFKVPGWAENGVRLSRLGLKTGVILLGALYSFAELAQLGKLSVLLIGVFVLGSVWLVLLIGARRNLPNSMTGVLSAGVGVCGVSAAVAAAPVVQAKSLEIAYTIGTILLFGVLCMFLFPIVGKSLGMGYIQFGAWAGTGILNSAQVAGAALAFQPGGIETLKAIRDAGMDCRVVILTVSDNADDLVAAIRSGADGYLLKDMEPEDLLAAIDEALNGRTVIGERLNGLLARAIRDEAAAKQRDTAALTDREKEILQGLAQGLSNKLIARNLDITEATVKVHVKNLLKKLGFHSRLEAAVWAVGRGTKLNA